MLVLSRTRGERILIGDTIELVVVKLKKDQVKLGIKAPADVNIVRSELVQEGEKANGD